MTSNHALNKANPMKRLLPTALGVIAALLAGAAGAAVPGIGNTDGSSNAVFNLTAADGYLNQPDGQTVYAWGYGCAAGSTPTFLPAGTPLATNGFCSQMQIPGPTLVVTEGQTVTVTLTNTLPVIAGNTSLLFPGFNVTATPAASQPATCTTSAPAPNGLLTTEVAPGCSVTYTFTAGSPGTRAYYSGTQGDLQVEMGLYGAIIVLPAKVPGVCAAGLPLTNPGNNLAASVARGETDFRLAKSAFDHPSTCYDREYLFQFSEMDPNIHTQAMFQVQAKMQGTNPCTAYSPATGCSLDVPTEPYHPAYFMINGRSMPDDMDPQYVPGFPHQPYNGNPHMHPGEAMLVRIIGQGRWQHPFHEHANHVRVLARDGNLLLSNNDTYSSASDTGTGSLAGPLMFTTTTTPGQAMDGLFTYTAKGLNWDMYGHNPASPNAGQDPAVTQPCIPDANGYNTGNPGAVNYYEWCQDHNKPLEAHPFGDVAGNGPMTLPNPNVFVNGPWYGGSPYLGPDATSRATYGTCTAAPNGNGALVTSCGGTGTTPPSGTIANSPASEAGFAFMWHSHNEREITTNNIFPGGMLMMMLVDSREFVIDETQ
jgi:FtsP/CotA-like multicopper oxidase with cupredoxin domain